ncbi:MAG: ribosome assembly cofactor RimP [Bacteroidota bacterium]|jgi:ribosome maturation factor RimP
MLENSLILNLINSHISGTDKFLVDLKISPSNKIEIYIDAVSGLSVKDCVSLSRHIESSLDREKEDFELEVSSPGAEEPFKVREQYTKNVGRKLKIELLDGTELKGTLKKHEGSTIILEILNKEKKERGKGKITKNENITLELDKVKKAGVILSFK